jgi:hypothetical protein
MIEPSEEEKIPWMLQNAQLDFQKLKSLFDIGVPHEEDKRVVSTDHDQLKGQIHYEAKRNATSIDPTSISLMSPRA